MSLSKPSKGIFWVSFIIGLFAILNEYLLHVHLPIISDIGNFLLLVIGFVLLALGVIIKKL